MVDLVHVVTFVNVRHTTVERKNWWDSIVHLSRLTVNDNWVVLKDFNEVLHLDERAGLEDRSNIGLADFCATIEHTDLIEMHNRGGVFTWLNGQMGERRSDSKIDCVFINDNWSV